MFEQHAQSRNDNKIVFMNETSHYLPNATNDQLLEDTLSATDDYILQEFYIKLF